MFCFVGDISGNAEWRLMNALNERYKNRQSLRAVSSPSEAVNVTLSMKMVQIIELVSMQELSFLCPHLPPCLFMCFHLL